MLEKPLSSFGHEYLVGSSLRNRRLRCFLAAPFRPYSSEGTPKAELV